jgi:uncharacterized protein YjbJ (UPF0337 family)
MDKDRVEGKLKDIGGRVQRQAGEWTGDRDAQAEGTKKQVEGKIQHAVGKAKDALKNAGRKRNSEREERSREEKDVA